MVRLRLILGVLILAGLAVLAARTLFPDRSLRLEAELARLTPEAAFDRLEAEAATGQPLGAYLAFRQAELAAMMGRDAEAVARLDALAAGGTLSAELAEARAALALRAGNDQAAAQLLAEAQRLSPDPARRQQLGYLYRRLRDAEAERALLAAEEPASLTAFEQMRLADLLAATGEREAEARVLRAILAANTDQGPEAAIRLTLVLLANGEPGELVAEARGWLDRPGAAGLITAMARALAGAGVAAEPLARDLAAAAPQAWPLLVMALTDAGQTAAARAVLIDGLIGLRGLQLTEWQALIQYSERSGDLGPLRGVLALTAAGAAPGAALMPVLRYHGAAALLPYRQHMTDEVLAAVPLVAAGWAAVRLTPEQAYTALRQGASLITTPQDRALWRNIAASLAESGVEARLRQAQASDPALQAMFRD